MDFRDCCSLFCGNSFWICEYLILWRCGWLELLTQFLGGSKRQNLDWVMFTISQILEMSLHPGGIEITDSFALQVG